MTSLVLRTAPATPIITAAQVKEQARTFHTKEEDVFQRAADAAIAHADGPSGVMGRALITQEWTLIAPCFTATIPLGRLQSVDEVRYLDEDGATQTLATTEYRVTAGTDNRRLAVKVNKTLPTTLVAPDAVEIDFTAGYGNAATDVPDDIISATLLLAVHLYQNRSAAMIDPRASEISRLVEIGYESLVRRHILYGRGT